MHAAGTEYDVLRKPGAYRPLRKLAEKAGSPLSMPLSFPTVAAYREGNPVGFLSSTLIKGRLVAGPLVVDVPGNPVFVVLRLVDVYEAFLRTGGIDRYMFSLDKSREKWAETVMESLNVEPAFEGNGKLWFERMLA